MRERERERVVRGTIYVGEELVYTSLGHSKAQPYNIGQTD